MTKFISVSVLVALFFAGEAAMAGAGAVTVWRGSSGVSGVERTTAAGVTVYRAPKPIESELAGAGPAPAMSETTIVVVECRRPPKRFMRTQGFYSGHPGYSRRFTQGFWSGSVDVPRSTARTVTIERR